MCCFASVDGLIYIQNYVLIGKSRAAVFLGIGCLFVPPKGKTKLFENAVSKVCVILNFPMICNASCMNAARVWSPAIFCGFHLSFKSRLISFITTFGGQLPRTLLVTFTASFAIFPVIPLPLELSIFYLIWISLDAYVPYYPWSIFTLKVLTRYLVHDASCVRGNCIWWAGNCRWPFYLLFGSWRVAL